MMGCSRINLQTKSFLLSSGCHQVYMQSNTPTAILSKSPPSLCCSTVFRVRSANRYLCISVSNAPSSSLSSSLSCSSTVLCRRYYNANLSKPMKSNTCLVGTTLTSTSARGVAHVDFSLRGRSGSRAISLSMLGVSPSFKCSTAKPPSRFYGWSHIFSGMVFGTMVGYCSVSDSVYAEVPQGARHKEQKHPTSMNMCHGKPVYSDYSVIGIPGDGRCLFRSVAHGACIRSGTSSPSESLQRELADELRAKVADEFIKRREETEWFIEGDFDSYVEQIRKPHVWGGEPELLMLSHVLRMPITVYMHDENAGGLISIAEYGQDYGNKENPIRVLYHGFGHYDALLIPGTKKRGGPPQSKL